MGLQKHYIKYGQNARDKIFGMTPETRRNGPTPLSMLISHGAKFNNSKFINKIKPILSNTQFSSSSQCENT